MRKESSLLLMMLLLAGGFGLFLLLGRTEDSVEVSWESEGEVAAPAPDPPAPVPEPVRESPPPQDSAPPPVPPSRPGGEEALDEAVKEQTVTGRVVDFDTEAPLAGATLRFWSGDVEDPWKDEAHDFLGTTATDAAGRFRLTFAHKTDRVSVQARARGYATQVESCVLDEPNLIGLSRGYAVVGKVVDEAKTVVPRAEVLILDNEDISLTDSSLDEILARAKADIAASGVFLVRADREGRFEVQGLDSGSSNGIIAFDEKGRWGRTTVDFNEEDDESPVECTVRIEPRCSLRLRVFLPDGSTHPKPPAQLEGKRCNFLGEDPSREKDGSLFWRRLPPGRVTLHLWPAGFQPVTQHLVLDKDREETVHLTRGRRITGIVVDSKDRPLQAKVAATLSRERRSRSGKSGADGRFLFQDMPTDPVRISAQFKGLCRGSVLVPEGKTDVRIVLRPFPVFFGTVDLAQAGAPVSYILLPGIGTRDSKIPLDSTGRFEKSWTGYQGGYTFTAIAEVPGWAPINLGTFKPKPGDRIDLGVLSRPQARELSCIVTGPDGAPVKGAGVVLRFHRYSRQGRSLSDDKGRLTLAKLPPWPGYLIAYPPKGGQKYPRVVRFFSAEETGPLSIRFLKGGIVEGRVVYPSGDPVTHCAVHIHPLAEDGTVGECYGACSHVDQKGFFRSENVQPGRYRIVFYELGPDVFNGPEILVEAGKTLTVRVNAPPPPKEDE